jgi:hypothetical protein
MMVISKEIFEDHEERVAAITKIAVERKALVLNESADELTSADDPDAEALVYAAAFQAWVDHKIHGTPNEIFDAIQSALEV